MVGFFTNLNTPVTKVTSGTTDAGFAKETIYEKPEKRAGVFEDIIPESYQVYSGIVAGRREVIGFAQQHFRGRFSEKIIKSLDIMPVWAVNWMQLQTLEH